MERPEQTIEHESYVLVSVSRRQGQTHLFGSALAEHSNFMTLSVSRGKMIRSDSGDSYYGSISGDLFEIDMSAAQFADMMTSMNVGLGVPGTLRRLLNKRVEPPPVLPTEADNVRSEFKNRLKGFAKVVASASARLDLILEKKALSKSDRTEAKNILGHAVTELTSNIPFFLEMYQEATEKIRTAAKTEIEAFMQIIVSHMGIKALKDGQVPPPQLPGKTE